MVDAVVDGAVVDANTCVGADRSHVKRLGNPITARPSARARRRTASTTASVPFCTYFGRSHDNPGNVTVIAASLPMPPASPTTIGKLSA